MPSLAKLSTLNKLSIFNCQPNSGFFSAVAESNAASQYTWVIWCFLITESNCSLFKMSNTSNGPDCSCCGCFISDATTFSLPYIFLNSSTNSVPICPEEPTIKILSDIIFGYLVFLKYYLFFVESTHFDK